MQVGVVAPVVQVRQRAPNTGSPLRRGVVKVVDARTVLDKATADVQRDFLRVAHGAVRRLEGGYYRWALQKRRVGASKRLRQFRRQKGVAKLRARGGRDRRITNGDPPVGEARRSKRARRRQIQRHLALGVADLGVGLGKVVDGEAADGRHLRALYRRDVVVERVEVECIDIPVIGSQVASCHIDDPVPGQRRWNATQDGRHSNGRPPRKTGGGTDRKLADGALALLEWIGACGAEAQRDVAAAIGQVCADGQVGAVAFGIALLGHAIGGLRLDAAEVPLQHKVDDASDSVGTVHG